jgi:hypothetical protein
MAAADGRSDVMVFPWGGYAQAERCRCAAHHSHVPFWGPGFSQRRKLFYGRTTVATDACCARAMLRARLVLGSRELLEPQLADPQQLEGVAALQLDGNFMFDPAAHPDFLGAILGTGAAALAPAGKQARSPAADRVWRDLQRLCLAQPSDVQAVPRVPRGAAA